MIVEEADLPLAVILIEREKEDVQLMLVETLRLLLAGIVTLPDVPVDQV